MRSRRDGRGDDAAVEQMRDRIHRRMLAAANVRVGAHLGAMRLSR
jgi:hypothetical protein